MRYCGVEASDFPEREFDDSTGVLIHQPRGGTPHQVPGGDPGHGPPLPGLPDFAPPAPLPDDDRGWR
jgi:hypothetical protein